MRTARDLVQATFEALWGAGFRVVGAVRTHRPQLLKVGNNSVVLVVAPHPDDEVAGCGGTIVRHRRAGDTVIVATVTDGGSSRALGLPPDQTAEVRRLEAVAAAEVLGVERLEWLGFPEGEWRHAEVVQRLHNLLHDVEPNIVYAPSRVDFHPGHHAVAHALSEALAPGVDGAKRTAKKSADATVRVFQVHVPLGAALANTISDVSTATDEHDRASEAHASQRGSLVQCRRMKRYAARAHNTGALVEEFCEMSASEYVVMHTGNPADWVGEYRALRYLAITDPAGYLVGRSARRKLSPGP